MTDLSFRLQLDAYVRTFVYDPVAKVYYIATTNQTVVSFNPVTHESHVVATFDANLGSMAMSSDGTHLLVGLMYPESLPSGDYVSTVYNIPLATADDTSTYVKWTRSGGIDDDYVVDRLATDAAGELLYATSFNVHVASDSGPAGEIHDLDTPGSPFPEAAWLFTSENGRYVLMEQNGGNISVYDSQTHSIIASGGVGGTSVGYSDISEAAGLIINRAYGALQVFDLSMHEVRDLTSILDSQSLQDVKFNVGGHQMLAWDDTAKIIQIYDTQNWNLIGSADVGVDFALDMVLSKDGHFLSLLVAQGLMTVDLFSRIQTSQTGTSGDDVFFGTQGQDTVDGGDGNDTFDFGTGFGVGLTVSLSNGPQDTSNGVDTLVNIENVRGGDQGDLIIGNDGGNRLEGSAGNDVLTGLGGNDILDGGTGTDVMAGGDGDDTYYVDGSDTVTEAAGAGNDTVYTSENFSLFGRAIENLILTGSDIINGTGNSSANTITGNSNNNSLSGESGADTLNGGGGDDRLDGGNGADIMAGGIGDDIYIVDNFSDSTSENAGEGTDTVITTKSWTLSADIEILQLNGSDNINATGNDLNNTLVGNSGNNVLDGGAGADVMTGHKGDDVYIVDNAGDTVVEAIGDGTDLVKSSVGFGLSGQHIENLTLTGADNINATGNSLTNSLIGNSGNNVLNGGVGADTMTGGLGDDSYVVDNAGDIVKELDGGGTDAVNASVTFTLAGQFIENLTLTGTSAINGTGNHLDNIIKGNNAANILNGGGGHDVLSGKGGADTFIFTAASGADTISDFSAVQNDSIDVSAYTHGTAHSTYITQVGSDTIVNLGHGNIITVQNTAMADVGAHMVW